MNIFKKNNQITSLIFFVLIICFSLPLLFSSNIILFAEDEVENGRVYVALGDSISEGYAINLTNNNGEPVFEGNDDYNFIENSYTYNLNEYLTKSYKYVKGYNFSRSGYTCQDLVNFITSFYNLEKDACKNPSSNNSVFNTLTNLQIYNALTTARTITITIGANNVLQKAQDVALRYLGLSGEDITIEEIETILKNEIIGTNTIKGFQAELTDLLGLLNSLNPSCEIYFNAIYNPYSVLDLSDYIKNNQALLSLISPNFTQERLNDISSLTELALNGGTDSTGNIFRGINSILDLEIDRFNAILDANFYLVDSKAKFDNKLLAGRESYKEVVNTRLDELDSASKLNEVKNNNAILFSKYLDPHPTEEGHKLLSDSFKEKGIGTHYNAGASNLTKILIFISIGAFVVIIILGVVVALTKTKRRVC